jgi:hypothetical protein
VLSNHGSDTAKDVRLGMVGNIKKKWCKDYAKFH